MHGTPVKSCMRTRAGRKAISRSSPPEEAPRQRGQVLDVGGGDRHPVLEPEEVLEEDFQRVGEPADPETVLEGGQPEDVVPAVADGDGSQAIEGVHPCSLPLAALGRPMGGLAGVLHEGVGAIEAGGDGLRVARQQLRPGVRQPHLGVAVAAQPHRPVRPRAGLVQRDPFGDETPQQPCLHIPLIGCPPGGPSNAVPLRGRLAPNVAFSPAWGGSRHRAGSGRGPGGRWP